MADRLSQFQRNSSYAAFVCVICFAAVVFLTKNLADMIAPFVWAAFFAMPLSGLISALDHIFTAGFHYIRGHFESRQVMRELSAKRSLDFSASSCLNCVYIEDTELSRMFIDSVNYPGRGCLKKAPMKYLKSCFRRRVKVVELRHDNEESVQENSSNVNHLVEHWAYYIKDPFCEANATAANSATTPLATTQDDPSEIAIELFLDSHEQYPAIIELDSSPRAQSRCIHGKLEIDRASSFSWTFAALTALAIVVVIIGALTFFIMIGVRNLQDNVKNYQKGISEFGNWCSDVAKNLLPKDMADDLANKISTYLSSYIPTLATAIVSELGSLGGYFLFFFIYLCFWIFEPLPINSSVTSVFKTYLLMKTIVCVLFASMMSLVLLCLQCPLWQLFFVVTFLLNYIPEVGPILAAALMTPAVLFDGQFDMHTRLVHFVWLAVLGVVFKIITGNFIEVHLYANKGGQFMRMHPVVLMATMMICYALLGVTGMFLSIPIVAAIKYYMLASNMPPSLLNPALVIIEGEQAGPHKNFVDKHRGTWEKLGEPVSMETVEGHLVATSELGRRDPEDLE